MPETLRYTEEAAMEAARSAAEGAPAAAVTARTAALRSSYWVILLAHNDWEVGRAAGAEDSSRLWLWIDS